MANKRQTGKRETLTPRQRAFVDAYLKNPNAKQAAIAAGYSAESAETNGPRLLRNAQVAAIVGQRVQTAAEEAGVTAVEVLKELRRIASVDVSEAFNEHGGFKSLNEIPEDVRRSIASIEHGEYGPKVRFWDKTKALESLGKHLKLFTDQVDMRVSVRLEDLVLERFETDSAGGEE